MINAVREKVKKFLIEALGSKEISEEIRVIGIDNANGNWTAQAEVVDVLVLAHVDLLIRVRRELHGDDAAGICRIRQISRRLTSQLVVNNRHQLVERGFVAFAPTNEQLSYIERFRHTLSKEHVRCVVRQART